MTAAVKVPMPRPPALQKPVKKASPVKGAASTHNGSVPALGLQRRDMEVVSRQLRSAANCWHKSDADPRKDVHRARQAYRSLERIWPTVLTVSPMVFEDLRNDLGVTAYFSGIQLSIHDPVSAHYSKLYMARYFGVDRIEVSEHEQGASVGMGDSPPEQSVD